MATNGADAGHSGELNRALLMTVRRGVLTAAGGFNEYGRHASSRAALIVARALHAVADVLSSELNVDDKE